MHIRMDNDMKYTAFKEILDRLNEVETVIESHVNDDFTHGFYKAIVNLAHVHYLLESVYTRYTNKYYRDKLPTEHADTLSAMLPQQECETCGAMVNDGQLAHNEDTDLSECDNCSGWPSESEQHGDIMYPAEELKR